MIWNEILCLGDSITYGARYPYGRYYPAELGKILTNATGQFYFCHNHGFSGETSSDLLRRTWSAANSHSNANLALLMIGTNDTKIPIPTEVYEDNMRQMISILRVHGMEVIVATLPKLGFTPLYIKNVDFIEKYNDIILKLSNKMHFETCDMSGTEKYYIDNVHYTHEGYNLLAKRWANKILGIQKGIGKNE